MGSSRTDRTRRTTKRRRTPQRSTAAPRPLGGDAAGSRESTDRRPAEEQAVRELEQHTEEVEETGGRPDVPVWQEGAMDQLGVTAPEPLVVVTGVDITLIEGAARDLEDLDEEATIRGHRPCWAYCQVPDGLALCVGCWRPIAARQLGAERCPGPPQPQARALPSGADPACARPP